MCLVDCVVDCLADRVADRVTIRDVDRVPPICVAVCLRPERVAIRVAHISITEVAVVDVIADADVVAVALKRVSMNNFANARTGTDEHGKYNGLFNMFTISIFCIN